MFTEKGEKNIHRQKTSRKVFKCKAFLDDNKTKLQMEDKKKQVEKHSCILQCRRPTNETFRITTMAFV